MARIHVPIWLRTLVLERANERCEYCLIHQDDSPDTHQPDTHQPDTHQPDTHQKDHVIAIRHGGRTIRENLACACALCNHFKGTDFATIDPASGVVIMLFNPRTQIWNEHFVLEGARIAGLTPTGQATIELLHLNDDARLLEREVLIAENRYPR